MIFALQVIFPDSPKRPNYGVAALLLTGAGLVFIEMFLVYADRLRAAKIVSVLALGFGVVGGVLALVWWFC